MTDISARIGSLKLDSCVFNAAGAKDETLKELEVIAGSKSPAVLMKSCTRKAREGNPKPRYAQTEWGSINSMGLPNLGCRDI